MISYLRKQNSHQINPKKEAKQTVKLAIIIASCNRETRAKATAQSILDAGIGYVVLVDDGSRLPYESQSNDERLKLLRLSFNSGPSAARNHGVRNTQAEWIIFLDDDDSLDPGFTDWVQKNLNSTLKDIDLVHFGYRLINQENHSSSEATISTNVKPCVLSGTWMMRRQFFLDIGGYEERLRYSENTDLIDRAIQTGARSLHAGFPILLYTVGRPKRREEMAERRAEACLFYLKHRSNHSRFQTLKIGLINSWWNKNPRLSLQLIAAFIQTK